MEEAIDNLGSGIVGLFRRADTDPHKDDAVGWFIWAIDRCSAAAVTVQKLAGEYDVEIRLAPKLPQLPVASG